MKTKRKLFFNTYIFENEGGSGKTGKVLELRGWDRESGFSVACVEWSATGTTNVYRIGHKGKVDLKYVQEGDGGFYYRDHLIVLGKIWAVFLSLIL